MKKIYFIALFFFSIFLIYNCSSQNKNPKKIENLEIDYEVIFDQSNEQVYSPFDEDFSGMSILCNLLRKNGFNVSLNFTPLKIILKNITPKGKILFLGAAMYRRYSYDDLNAIDIFLKKGGAALVIGEHNNVFCLNDMQNDLLEKYNIKILDAAAESASFSFINRIWPLCSSDALKIDSVTVYFPAPLKLSEQSIPLLEIKNYAVSSKKIIAAYSPVGNGKIAVIGDAEIFWNMIEGFGISNKNNSKFVINFFKFLSDFNQKQKKIAKNFPHRKQSKGKILLVSEAGSILNNSNSELQCALEQFYNVGYDIIESSIDNIDTIAIYNAAIIISPFNQNHSFEFLNNFKKVIIIYDGQTDILAANNEFKEFVESLTGVKIKNPDLSINNFLKKHNIKINRETLINGKNNENHFIINLTNDSPVLQIKRSACLTLLKENSVTKNNVYTIQSLNVWSQKNITPLSKIMGAKPFINQGVSNNSNIINLIYFDENVFVLSDIEILNNDFYFQCNTILNQILDWIN